ncbi:MAG TPA: hypothetical protein VF708_15355 [Pyrinomonadaceae bacterium]
MTTRRQTSKNIREREVEDKYRLRLHRIVAHYLAIRAWCNGFDCIVLSRNNLKKLFDIDSTPEPRIEQIKRDIKPWLKDFQPYYSKYDRKKTHVDYLFLFREKDALPKPEDSYFPDIPAVRKAIKKINTSIEPKSPKAVLFSDLIGGEAPTEEEIISRLTLLAVGLKPAKKKEAGSDQQTKPTLSKGETGIAMSSIVQPLTFRKL